MASLGTRWPSLRSAGFFPSALRMGSNPHFLELASWLDAEDVVDFQPRIPRNSLGPRRRADPG